MSDLHRNVERWLRRIESVEVAAKIVPRDLEVVGVLRHASLERLPGLPDQRSAKAGPAIAGEFERHALAHLALGRVVQQERHVAVRVQIDESGAHDESGCVDGRYSLAVELADSDDLAAHGRDVGHVSGTASTIEDASVLDQQVIHERAP